MTATRNDRRQLTGVVTSTAGTKTITVQVERRYKHPKYGKYIRSHTKYTAHDEAEKARMGDIVVIDATRPLSKRKRWRLNEVLTSSILEDANLSEAEATTVVEAQTDEGGES